VHALRQFGDDTEAAVAATAVAEARVTATSFPARVLATAAATAAAAAEARARALEQVRLDEILGCNMNGFEYDGVGGAPETVGGGGGGEEFSGGREGNTALEASGGRDGGLSLDSGFSDGLSLGSKVQLDDSHPIIGGKCHAERTSTEEVRLRREEEEKSREYAEQRERQRRGRGRQNRQAVTPCTLHLVSQLCNPNPTPQKLNPSP
jgi:hypothetical protein